MYSGQDNKRIQFVIKNEKRPSTSSYRSSLVSGQFSVGSYATSLLLCQQKVYINRPKVSIVILILIIFALYGIRVYLMSTFSEHDYYYDETRKQLRELQKENSLLREELLTQQSLTSIKTKALDMGFEETRIIILYP